MKSPSKSRRLSPSEACRYFASTITKITRPGGDPPSAQNIFGTDYLGRSVFELVVNGARLSVAFGLVTMVIATSVGITVGVVAGFFGGWADGVLMRLVDLMLAIPFVFVILVAASFFGGGEPLVLMIIFGLLSWPVLARLDQSRLRSRS